MKIAGKPNCLFTLPRIRPMASTSCSSSIWFIALLQHLLQSNQTWQLPKTYFSSWGWSNFFYMEQKWGLGRERRDLLWLKTEPSVPIPKTIRKIYWHIVALQCCVSFYCTAKWISESLSITYLSIYIYPLFFGFPSRTAYHQALSRVPCAIQWVLISFRSVTSDSLWHMDCSLPGSSVPGIFQARVLE